MSAAPDPAFWHGKRVLLTGHSGFKGGWLALWLHQLGAVVTGFSLPAACGSLYAAARIGDVCDSRHGDIRDAAAVAAVLRDAAPQIVLHLAAQPLVRAGYREPLTTYATNVMGSANLLDAVRAASGRGDGGVRVVVVVTTDKVYRQREPARPDRPHHEDDALGGHDPYSASKAACEIVVASYRDAFLRERGVAVATARAGNVIGGGDWSADRLIPDAVRAWQASAALAVRRPGAVRPWQHVCEPLTGYLRLAEALWRAPALAAAYNFGPAAAGAASVGEVVALARRAWDSDDAVRATGVDGMARRVEVDGTARRAGGDETARRAGVDETARRAIGEDGPHEADWLALDVTRAETELGVTPRWSLAEAVSRTVHWYRAAADGADARALCRADIDACTASCSRSRRDGVWRHAA